MSGEEPSLFVWREWADLTPSDIFALPDTYCLYCHALLGSSLVHNSGPDLGSGDGWVSTDFQRCRLCGWTIRWTERQDIDGGVVEEAFSAKEPRLRRFNISNLGVSLSEL